MKLPGTFAECPPIRIVKSGRLALHGNTQPAKLWSFFAPSTCL